MPLTRVFFSILIFSVLTSSVQAGERPPVILPPAAPTPKIKHMISDAIQVSMTRRGMKYFETGLPSLLEPLFPEGTNLEKGSFPGLVWNSQDSYSLRDTGMPAKQKNVLNNILDSLEKWIGLKLNEIKPSLQIGDLYYTAHFTRFSLVPDESLLRRLRNADGTPIRGGAVVVFEVEVDEARVQTNKFLARNLSKNGTNVDLGAWGFQNPTLEVRPQNKPLKIRLPFYVNLTDKKELQFEAISDQTTIDIDSFEMKYKKILSPPMALVYNGKTFPVNQSELEKKFKTTFLPKIMLHASFFLKSFATDQFPSLLNQEAKKILASGIENVTFLKPVGSPPNPCFPAADSHVWGLKLSKIEMKQNSLSFSLDSFIEDPKKPQTPVEARLNARGAPLLGDFSPDQYDFALSINRGVINRMIQLSFDRKYFNNLPLDSSDPQSPRMDLVALPEWDSTWPPALAPTGDKITYIKMKTKLRIHEGFLSGTQKWGLMEPFEIQMDIFLQMEIQSNGDIRLFYYDIDTRSVAIDNKYIRNAAKLFYGANYELMIRSQAVAILQKIAERWRKTAQEVLDGPFPLTRNFNNLWFDPQALSFDANGNLVIFMNFSDSGPNASSAPDPQTQCWSRGK